MTITKAPSAGNTNHNEPRLTVVLYQHNELVNWTNIFCIATTDRNATNDAVTTGLCLRDHSHLPVVALRILVLQQHNVANFSFTFRVG